MMKDNKIIEDATPLNILRTADGRTFGVDPDGTLYRGIAGGGGALFFHKVRETTTATGPRPPRWVCRHCPDFTALPNQEIGTRNHLVRVHGLEEDSTEVLEAIAELRRLAKDKQWKERVKRDRRHDELLHEADRLRVRAIGVDASGDLPAARKLRAQANALDTEARALR